MFICNNTTNVLVSKLSVRWQEERITWRGMAAAGQQPLLAQAAEQWGLLVQVFATAIHSKFLHLTTTSDIPVLCLFLCLCIKNV
jgi:hypothetical protein